MTIRQYSLSVKNRLGATLLAIVLLGLGGVLLALGLTVLLGIVLGGAALGGAAYAYRRITGKEPVLPSTRSARAGLDPANEVFPSAGDTRRELPRARD